MLISIGLLFWGVSAQPAFQSGAELSAVAPALRLVLCAIVQQCWFNTAPLGMGRSLSTDFISSGILNEIKWQLLMEPGLLPALVIACGAYTICLVPYFLSFHKTENDSSMLYHSVFFV